VGRSDGRVFEVPFGDAIQDPDLGPKVQEWVDVAAALAARAHE
jgi:hypothetical protein